MAGFMSAPPPAVLRLGRCVAIISCFKYLWHHSVRSSRHLVIQKQIMAVTFTLTPTSGEGEAGQIQHTGTHSRSSRREAYASFAPNSAGCMCRSSMDPPPRSCAARLARWRALLLASQSTVTRNPVPRPSSAHFAPSLQSAEEAPACRPLMCRRRSWP